MKFGALILFMFSCFAFWLSAHKLFLVFTHPIKFKEEIMLFAKEFDLAPEFVSSVINVESSFNENAKSNKNAIGLMQIKLSTANYLDELKSRKLISESELFKPKTNIKYGCEYLKYLIDKFQNINTALASYNAGETRVRSWLKSKEFSIDGKTLTNIPYNETKNYVEKINKNLKYYQNFF